MTQETPRFSFSVRPGYHSKTLLIEFATGSGSPEMMAALKRALDRIEARQERTEDLWMNDEVLWHMNSRFGEFLVSSDIWGFVFILAEENQTAIPEIERALLDGGEFRKVEVDFSRFK